jgi:hypothetical protein
MHRRMMVGGGKLTIKLGCKIQANSFTNLAEQLFNKTPKMNEKMQKTAQVKDKLYLWVPNFAEKTDSGEYKAPNGQTWLDILSSDGKTLTKRWLGVDKEPQIPPEPDCNDLDNVEYAVFTEDTNSFVFHGLFKKIANVAERESNPFTRISETFVTE